MAINIDHDTNIISNLAIGTNATDAVSKQALDDAIAGVSGGGGGTGDSAALNTHIADQANPHVVTASQVGALPISGGTLTGNLDLGDSKIVTSNNKRLVLQPDGTGPIQASTSGTGRGAGSLDLQRFRATGEQVASGSASIILGGSNNTASALNSLVMGGTNNIASGSASVIGGGNGNHATGVNSVIDGGSDNTTVNGFTSVKGGKDGTASGIYAIVLGGNNNTASGYSSMAFGKNSIASGVYSSVSGYGSIASGGYSTASGYYATASGDSSTASGAYSAGQTLTEASGLGSYARGFNCLASGNYSYASGSNCDATGNYAQSLGHASTASGAYSRAAGSRALADKYGQFSHAAGFFDSIGDAQKSSLVLRKETTDATATNLALNGVSDEITLLDQDLKFFTIKVAGRRTDADGEGAAYKFEGAVDNNGGTTALVGSPLKTVIAEDNTAWDVDVTADNTGLHITVTGEAGKTIRWVASVDLVEVNG